MHTAGSDSSTSSAALRKLKALAGGAQTPGPGHTHTYTPTHPHTHTPCKVFQAPRAAESAVECLAPASIPLLRTPASVDTPGAEVYLQGHPGVACFPLLTLNAPIHGLAGPHPSFSASAGRSCPPLTHFRVPWGPAQPGRNKLGLARPESQVQSQESTPPSSPVPAGQTRQAELRFLGTQGSAPRPSPGEPLRPGRLRTTSPRVPAPRPACSYRWW